MYYIRENIIRKFGAVAANLTGLKALVWTSQPSAASPNPAFTLLNLATDVDGRTNWGFPESQHPGGGMIWVVVLQPGTGIISAKRLTPILEE